MTNDIKDSSGSSAVGSELPDVLRGAPQSASPANGTSPGAVPADTDRLPGVDAMENVRTWLYRSDRTPGRANVRDWPGLCQDDENLLWVDLTNPSDELIAEVAKLLGIDPRAARLTQRYNTRPMVRTFKDHYVVTSFSVDVDESGEEPTMTVTEINAVAGRNFLLSVHNRPIPFLKDLEERTATNPQLGRLDSSYLLYVLLDTLVADYSREFDEVEDEVERLEELLLREPGREALNDVMRMKRHIHTVRRIVGPHRQAFGVLIAADSPAPTPQVESYFRDLIQHLDNLLERLEHARDTVTGSYNLYISNISYRTNQELRVLTFLSAILLPMTVITGIFGTNFTLREYEFFEGFYVMLAGMGVISAGMLAFFRWRRWL
jgi:magnesium transporter